ncbi:MAG: class I adenylate-forming enzyme family protein [Nitriliruptorales bacterium]
MAGSTGSALVALRTPPGFETAIAIERLWSHGQAVLPVPGGWSEEAVARLLELARPHALVDLAGRHPLPDPLPVDPDTALVVATSGATGEPKAVELAHDALQASARASLDRLDATEKDRWLCCLPLSHVAGILVLVRAQLLGTAPILHPRFDVAAVASEQAATHVSLVPTMLARLLDAGVALHRYERVLLGGAAPPPRLLDRADGAGVRVTLTYGMTETAGGCVYDGEPLDGVEVELREGGRIAVRGPVLMRGYRAAPAGAAPIDADGWLVTPDIGELDSDGRLHVLGRADDVIVTGGEKVFAGQLGALLEEHKKVAQAAVVGRPDPEWGERVVAVCVPADPARPPTLEELRRFVSRRAASHAAPRDLLLVDELPRTELGKLVRTALPNPDERIDR